VTGLPPGTEYGIDVQCGWPPPIVGAPPCALANAGFESMTLGAFSGHPIVANQIVATDEVVLMGVMSVTPATGATVTAAPATFSWAALPYATVYCVLLMDVTASTTVSASGGNCGKGSPARFETSVTSWRSPTLVAGHEYFFSVTAYDKTPDLDAWLTRGVLSTQLGAGISEKIVAR
jgi:hypothetical protein